MAFYLLTFFYSLRCCDVIRVPIIVLAKSVSFFFEEGVMVW
jgi:hypothetical protein